MSALRIEDMMNADEDIHAIAAVLKQMITDLNISDDEVLEATKEFCRNPGTPLTQDEQNGWLKAAAECREITRRLRPQVVERFRQYLLSQFGAPAR